MKSRLDVWAPLIQTVTGDGNFSTVRTTDKWITCHTIEDVDKNIRRGNALLEVSIADQLYRPRQATLVVANRFQDFRAPNNSTFTHVYKDSDGNDAFSSPNTCLLRQQWGVHSYFFADKMRVRVVDTHTNLVLFAGRIHKIDKKYREGEGAVIELQCADNLELMSAHDLKNLGKEYDFGTGKRRSQLIQAMLNIGYTPQILSTPNKIITGSDINPYLTALNDPDQDIVSSDAGTTSLNSKYSRFEQSEEQISNAVKWTPASSGSSNLLSELLRVARNEPHDDSSVQNKFGYDFYVDPNIGEGNLTATVAPRPQMFNYFKRGNRLSSAGGASQDAADFGLVVKVPVVKTDFSTSHRDSQKAAELMMSGSEFDSPDTSSYTAINLTYSIGEDSYEKVANTGTAESQKSGTHTKKFELIYANQFGTESSSGTELFTWVDKRLDDHFAPNDRMTPGVHSAEWCNLYREDGTTLLYDDSVRTSQRVCRIQFQSTQTSSSNDFGYILISDVGQTYVDSSGVTKYPKWPVINHSSDDYVVLKGQTSGATCRINIEAKDPMEGRPANVWGGERPFAMTQMNIVNPNVLRYDLATRLQSSTSAYHVGKFSIAKAPYYCLDVVSSSIGSASVGSGQSITCTKPAGGGVIDLSNYGVREGMLVTVMTDNQYTTIKEVSNKDIYGYIYNMPDDDEIEVDFTESVALSSNDTNYLRIYIPIRVGDIIVVEDVLSQVLGNHVVTKINYAEQRGTVTQFETLGRNDRVASTQEAPKSITAPPNTVAGRIGKNARETNEQVSDTAHMFEVTHKGDQPVRSKGLTLTFPANNRIEWSGASAQLILPNQEVIQIAESGSGTTSGTSHATYGLGSSGMQTGQLYVMYIDLRADNVLPGEEYNIRTAIYSAYLTVEGDQVIPLLKVRHAGSSGTLPQVDAFLNFIYEGAENLVVTTQAEVIEKAKTFHQDDEPAANVSTHGDLWFKTSDDPITLWMYNTSVDPDAWQKKNDNAPEGDGNKIFRQGRTQGSPSGIPTSENIGDIWIDTDTYTAADGSTRVKNEMYIANVANATTIVTSGNGWYRRDDVDAINNASTSINGGLINTARIILKEGGANTEGLFMTGGATFSPSSGQSYIQMDHTSIKGVSRTNTTDTTQFEIKAEDGKAYFGGGAVTAEKAGLVLNQTESANGSNTEAKIRFTTSDGHTEIYKLDADDAGFPDRTMMMGTGGTSTPAGWLFSTQGPDTANNGNNPDGFIYAGTRSPYTMIGRNVASGGMAGMWFRCSDDISSYIGETNNSYMGYLHAKDDGKLYWRGRGSAGSSSDIDLTSGSGGSSLTIQEEGSSLSTAATTLNFVGSAVTASGTGSTKTITISGGGSSDGWKTFAVSADGGSVSGSSAIADQAEDLFTFIAGNGITLTGGGTNDNLKIESTGGGVVVGDDPVTWSGRHRWSYSSNTVPAIWVQQAPGQFDEGFWLKNESSTPGAPSSGYIRVYSEANFLKYKNASGNEVTLVEPYAGINLSQNLAAGVLTINHDNSGASAGNYTNTNLTIDARGHITAASNGSSGGGETYTHTWVDDGNDVILRLTGSSSGNDDIKITAGSNISLTPSSNGEEMAIGLSAGYVSGSGSTNKIVKWAGSGSGASVSFTNWGFSGSTVNEDLVSVGSTDKIGSDDYPLGGIVMGNNTTIYNAAQANVAANPVIEFLDNGGYTKFRTKIIFATFYVSGTMVELYKTNSPEGGIAIASSTSRLKNNIRPLELDSSKIHDLELKSYELKGGIIEDGILTVLEDDDQGTHHGLIAEQVAEVIPELVILDGEDKPFNIDYHRLNFLLLEELKKLKTRIEVLEGA